MTVVLPVAASHGFPTPSEEPWLGLAKIQTDTGSGAHGRIYQFSVADVSAGTYGDREVWDYSPSTALTLRLEWYRYGATDGATSARVFFRYPDGGQIGTTVWQPSITPGVDIGVATTTVHLDDNPMDGVLGAEPLGVYELYAQLVGGADDGADTRGAPAVGTIPGGGGHARGIFSNNGLKLYDHWNRADGSAWNGTKWTPTTNTPGARTVDVQGSRGRIEVLTSTARATAQMADIADSEVNFTYEFSDRNSGSDLRIYLRGSGATGANQMPNAYRLDIDSGSTTVKLKKVVSGTATTIGSFTYNPDGLPGPDPGRHRVRFRVEGSKIKAAMWPDGAYDWDGAWNISVTNTAVTAPGKLQLTHYRASTSTGRSVYIEDLTLFGLPEPGSHDPEFSPPPGTPWNGKKVYLSPAQHPGDSNRGCDDYSENEGARDTANRTKDLLTSRGYKVMVGQGRPGHNLDSSNAWGATIHVPIHSNAGSVQCTDDPATAHQGTRVIWESTEGQRLSQEILNSLGPMSPGMPDNLCDNPSPCTGNRDLDELSLTTAVAAYAEMAYHTYRPDMVWLRDQRPAIADGIADAIDRYFGFPSP